MTKMTTTYGSARAGHTQSQTPRYQQYSPIYTPSTSWETLGQIQNPKMFTQPFQSSPVFPYQTQGQNNPLIPPSHPPSCALPSWQQPHGPRLLSPLAIPTYTSPMPPQPRFVSSVNDPSIHTSRPRLQYPGQFGFVYETNPRHAGHESASFDEFQSPDKVEAGAQNDREWNAKPGKQSRREGQPQKTLNDTLDWNKDLGPSIDTPVPSVNKTSVDDDTITINGVKYVKVETANQKDSDNPHSHCLQSPDDLVHEEQKSAGAPSELFENEDDYDGDYDGQDEAYSQAGDWDDQSNDICNRDETPVQEADLFSEAEVENAETCEVKADDQWDSNCAKGTLDDPIKMPSVFDEEPIRVLVGTDTIFEHQIRKSLLEMLLHQGGFAEQIDAMEEGSTVVLEGIGSYAFLKVIACLEAGYLVSCGTEVLSICDFDSLGQLYSASRFFRLEDLASSILDTFEDRKDPYGVFCVAEDIYASGHADDDLRSVVRKQVTFPLDRIGTTSDDWGDCHVALKIKHALCSPHFSELFRNDIADGVVDREIARNASKTDEATGSQPGDFIDEPPPRTADWDVQVFQEHVDEQLQADEPPKHTQEGEPAQLPAACCEDGCDYCGKETRVQEAEDQKNETLFERQSGLTAIAVRAYDEDWGMNFTVGDRISNVAVLTEYSRRPDGSIRASGVCNGFFGTFPVSHVKFEDQDKLAEDGSGHTAEDRSGADDWDSHSARGAGW